MKLKELKQISEEELSKIMKDDRERLRQLRFDLATGKIKNVREVRQVKKDIARIMTLLNPKHKIRNPKQIQSSNI